ncbi:MAG: D-arabinitol 4-dehydrogenase [Betaproteobacteria bacterium]
MSHPLVMLHLGLGFFHRAHQAFYLHQLMQSGSTYWVLAGGNTRPDMLPLIASLAAQNGVYTLETVSPAAERTYTRIEAIRTVVPYEPNLKGLMDIGASPSTRIISFTVTEAGYYLDAKNRLDLSFPDLQADVARARAGKPGGTIYAAMSAILRQRMQRTGGKVTLLNCDNLRNNGDRFREGLLQFIELIGDADLLAWVIGNTTSPNAMVDRITPRPTADVAERVKRATGWDDAVPVMSESFIQWVIEDTFCNGRPEWERVGVEMVGSVAPYEEAKIRILNAAHSAIAWGGTLRGYEFIHEGTQDPAVRKIAYDYITDDVIPCLSTPEHPSPIDLAAYRDVVLERFGNVAVRDSNQRVAMDAWSKIPGFIVPTIRERLAANASIASVVMLPALFLAFLQRWHRGEIPYEYHDQMMDPAAAHAICDASDPVSAFCGDRMLWGALANDPRIVHETKSAAERVEKFFGVRHARR